MTQQTITRLYRWTGFLAMIVVSVSFIRHDLAWSGNWIAQQENGRKTPTISAPWPAGAVVFEGNRLRIQQESVYVTVKIPRPFHSVDVSISSSSAAPPLEVGVETIPNTLRYMIVPAVRSAEGWTAHLDLERVQQRSGAVNVVFRFLDIPAGGSVEVERMRFMFQRPPQNIPTLINKLWHRLLAIR